MADDSVTEYVDAFVVKDAAGKQVESIFLAVCYDGVASVGAAIETSAHVIVFGKDVHKLSLAFITPLSAEDHTESGMEA